MAILSDQTIIIGLGLLFAYLIENSDHGKGIKMLANTIYFCTGIILMYYSVVTLIDQYTGAAIGLLIFLGGLVKTILDLAPDKN